MGNSKYLQTLRISVPVAALLELLWPLKYTPAIVQTVNYCLSAPYLLNLYASLLLSDSPHLHFYLFSQALTFHFHCDVSAVCIALFTPFTLFTLLTLFLLIQVPHSRCHFWGSHLTCSSILEEKVRIKKEID